MGKYNDIRIQVSKTQNKKSSCVLKQDENQIRLLTLLQKKGVSLRNIEVSEDGVFFSIHYKDFLKHKNLFFKVHAHVKIIEKNKTNRLWRARKTLLTFSLFCVMTVSVLLIYSSRIWSVEITGNEVVKTQDIYRCLKDNKVEKGFSKKDISIKNIKKELFHVFPEINWISVTIEGTKLKVDLRDFKNQEKAQNQRFTESPGNLVADKDGVIDCMVVKKGTACVKVGSSIKKGDELVSGVIKYLDNDGLEQTLFVKADALVTIGYERQISIFLPYSESGEAIDEELEKKLNKIIDTLEEKGVTIKEKNVTIEAKYEGKTLYCNFLLQETVGVLQDGNVSDGNQSDQ